MEKKISRIGEENFLVKKEKPQESVIFYAGTNKRRLNFLNHFFNMSRIVVSVPGGEEDQNLTTTEIATEKVEKVFRDINDNFQSNNFEIIAADTKIVTSSPNNKKKNLSEIIELFKELNDGNCQYVIESGSCYAFNTSKRKELIKSTMQAEITLKKEKLEKLKTEEGFFEYCKEFENLNIPPIEGKRLSRNLEEAAGGLDLATLAKIGAIEMIDNIPSGNTPAFRKALKKALFVAHAGFSNNILKSTTLSQEDVDRKIDSWPWLNQYLNNIFSDKKQREFSIVIPIHNDINIINLFDSLEQCKGFSETETIIVRNGDPSEKVVKLTDDFAHKHSNVKIVEIKKQGVAISRNKGIREASGTYIINLDSDVQVNRGFIEGIKKVIKENNPPPDIIVPLLLRDEGVTKLQKLISRHFTLITRRKEDTVHNPGLVLNRTIFKKDNEVFSKELRYSEDHEFAVRIEPNGYNIKKTRQAAVFHQADQDSKIVGQHRHYGEEKSNISRKYPHDRERTLNQKAKEIFFLPRFLEYLSKNGDLELAIFEGWLGFIVAKEFWKEEVKKL